MDRLAMDCFMSGGMASPAQDDSFSFSELFNFDGYGDICVPPASDQASTSVSSLGAQPSTGFGTSSRRSDFGADDADVLCKTGDGFPSGNGWLIGGSQDKLPLWKAGPSFCLSSDFISMDNSRKNGGDDGPSTSEIIFSKGLATIPKSLDVSLSLADKMLMALSFSKESFGPGFLAQFWMPVRYGDDVLLSTYDQPYLLDHMLSGYREISRSFIFSGRKAPGAFPGLPGRVFIARRPEWTSNVTYYTKNEYLRVNHAVSHRIRGSLAVPVLDSSHQSCCAVLELITVKEKPNFYSEIQILCKALQAVNLRTSEPQIEKQSNIMTMNQGAAFAEILDVLMAVCHAHMLPLALTWVPSSCNGAKAGSLERNIERVSSVPPNFVLQVLESACYISDPSMQGFLRACAEHQLAEGQGNAGKALQSNHPFFCSDVKAYHIDEYPIVHHARKFGLQAAVAIRLKSTYTGDDDYVLEFFLPADCKEDVQQQLLLKNLSSTMQRICMSLRTVSDAACRHGVSEANNSEGAGTDLPLPDISAKYSIKPNNFVSPKDTVNHHGQALNTRKHLEKKCGTVEKTVSLSVLQQYFSGSLKDAAKSIGVCPTTLKRICRQHGILRWPSRKILKVNRSLKKIQTVIDSVQGVEGALKYDPISGSLVAEVSTSEKLVSGILDAAPRDTMQTSSITRLHSGGKWEPDDHSGSKHETKSLQEPIHSKAVRDEKGKAHATVTSYNSPAKLACIDDRPGIMPWKLEAEEDASLGSYLARGRSHHNIPRASNSMGPASETGPGNNEIMEHSHPTSSSMTDSSNGSESSAPSKKFPENQKDAGKYSSTVTVKATYKEDTVRFKFLPSLGCTHLLEEISKRFKLAMGTFQLKYMDDEDEWVMLASDADLQECVEILESIGAHTVKILVRDILSSVGNLK